jgi:hypothetical protein
VERIALLECGGPIAAFLLLHIPQSQKRERGSRTQNKKGPEIYQGFAHNSFHSETLTFNS